MEPQPETQSIAGVFTPRLVARLHREGFEGTLRLHSGGSTRVVYFRRGDIASAASNAEEDRLHNILMREGRLTEPQLEMARSRQRPGASLGKVLIELGFLTPSELLQGARRQVRQILAACFALTDGTWQAAPGPLGPEVTNLGLPVRRLIFDALLEAGDRRVIVREMGSMESVYQPAEALAEALPQLRLDPAMEQVATMIDGHATLREISGRTSLDDFTVSRIVLALDILGLAVPASRPEPSSRPEPVAAPPPGRLIPVESDAAADAAVEVLPPEAPAAAAPRPAAGPPRAQPLAMLPPAPEAPAPVRAALEPDTGKAEEVAEPAGPSQVTSFAPRAEPAGPPDEAEPPPFPRDELPAFAGGTQGQTQTPFWTIDPETGERVHEGPVELTFDGAVTPRRSGPPDMRLVAGVGVGLVVLAALAIAFWTRSRDTEGAAEPVGAADAAAAIAAAGPTHARGEEHHPTIPGARPAGDGATEDGTKDGAAPTVAEPAGRAAEEDTAHDRAAAGGAQRDDTAPREEDATRRETVPPAAPERAAATPATETHARVPAAAPSPAPPPEVPRAANALADRLAPGHALLDSGDVPSAASAFASAIAALPADHVALHLMIACEESTVLKARAAVAAGDPLFVTPYALKDRRCYRLLWGIYPDREAAQAAAGTVPEYFTGAGITPAVVSLGRLRPAA
jgi:uncharacterized protein DUF4388